MFGCMKKADEISSRFTSDKMAKYGMTDWGMATRIIPQTKPPLFFWDSYNTMEEVLDHLMFSSIGQRKGGNRRIPSKWMG